MTGLMLAVLGYGFTCPQVIEVEQSPKSIPVSWSIDAPRAKHRLDDGFVLAGAPPSRAEIQGVYKDGAMKWTFSKGEYWAVCSYQRTTVRLIRKIEVPAECTFKSAKQGDGALATFECRTRK